MTQKRPATGTLAIGAADVGAALRRIELELTRKAPLLLEPTFQALNLRAPDGTTWRVSVAADGSLVTSQVMT